MPELPDVEVFRRYIAATSMNRKIKKVRVYENDLVQGVSAETLQTRLKDRKFTDATVYGKYCFVGLDSGDWLVLHFGMTGFMRCFKHETDAPEHTRVMFDFADGYHLAYDNRRKLGRVSLTESVEDFVRDKNLGPHALSPDFDRAAFKKALKGRRGTLKSTLMNQKIVAGIGNVYSDEILFQLAVHPKTRVDDLDPGVLDKVYKTMRRVLETAIDSRADPEEMPDSYLTAHRRSDGKCPKCGGDLEKIKVSGRSAWFCPACQKP